MSDVTQECIAVRRALASIGWNYLGGGPYPSAPVMRFTDGTNKLIVEVKTVDQSTVTHQPGGKGLHTR